MKDFIKKILDEMIVLSTTKHNKFKKHIKDLRKIKMLNMGKI